MSILWLFLHSMIMNDTIEYILLYCQTQVQTISISYHTIPYHTIPYTNYTKLQIANYKLLNYKLQITNCQLKIANYNLQIANYKMTKKHLNLISIIIWVWLHRTPFLFCFFIPTNIHFMVVNKRFSCRVPYQGSP